MADTITLTTPTDYQTLQRNSNGYADFTVTGTYTGTAPSAVQARWKGGAWTTLTSSTIGGGTFSGTMANQYQGQGTFEVRDAGNTGVTDSAAYVGIGDIFIVAGQSNAEMNLTNLQSYTHATLKATCYRDGLDTWGDLDETVDGATDPDPVRSPTGSVWPIVGEYILNDQSVPVGFITTAKGGTTIDVWGQGGTYYNNCVAMMASSGIGTNTPAAILWYQGEADTNDGTWATWGTQLSQMLDDMQADTGYSDLRLIAAMVGTRVPVYTRSDIDGMRAVQMAVWDSDADVYDGPVTYDWLLDEPESTKIHWTTNTEAAALAARWWQSIKRHCYEGTEGGPAQYSSSRIVDAGVGIEITFSVPNPPLQGGSATGWIVTDQNGARTVTDFDLTSADVITLTVDQALSGTVTVSYGSGNDAATLAGGDFYDSAAIAPLPPRPFYAVTVRDASITGNGRWGRGWW